MTKAPFNLIEVRAREVRRRRKSARFMRIIALVLTALLTLNIASSAIVRADVWDIVHSIADSLILFVIWQRRMTSGYDPATLASDLATDLLVMKAHAELQGQSLFRIEDGFTVKLSFQIESMNDVTNRICGHREHHDGPHIIGHDLMPRIESFPKPYRFEVEDVAAIQSAMTADPMGIEVYATILDLIARSRGMANHRQGECA